MANIAHYSLTFLFDGTQVSSDNLKKKASRAVGRHVLNVDLQVTPAGSQRLQLSIVGSLEDVDTCHQRINKELVDRHSCIRLRDEAGDEIRRQAYPILARIEQLLRAFINRAMIEIVGFDWWDALVPPGVRQSVLEVEEKSGQLAAIHHPLEFANFDHLIQIVSGSFQEWPEQKQLSTGDLIEILSDCHSIDEVRMKLAEKTAKISLWETVFARYFEERNEWIELEKSIMESAIPIRNKVMHHRPMHLYELQELSSTEENVNTVLASAKKRLSEKERTKARRASRDAFALIRRQQEEAVHAMLEPIRRQQEELARAMLEPFQRQQEEVTRAMLEPLRRQQEELARAMLEPFQRQQEEVTRAMLEPIRRQQEELANVMLEPLRKQQEKLARAMLEPIRSAPKRLLSDADESEENERPESNGDSAGDTE